jgi:hypothetical protein
MMRKKYWWIVGLIIALGVTLVSPLASPWPDGLERVAEDHGFLALAGRPLYEIIPDYIMPGVHNESAATILAGIFGVLVVFGLSLGAGHVLRGRHPGEQSSKDTRAGSVVDANSLR